MTRRDWSRNELILAFNLYCKTPFGRIHIHNPEIISLAKLIHRTPSAVSWKLANFARLDPALQKRQIAGASHGGKGEIDIWNEFSSNWDALCYESEILLAELRGQPIENSASIETTDLPRRGKERESLVRIRVNQGFFRSSVIAAYEGSCCITGLSVVELLNASHIVPWSVDQANRVNPRNGLCLNAIHDRAFDRGLITVTPDYQVVVSRSLIAKRMDAALSRFLLEFDGCHIRMPERFLPETRFLEYHNKEIFRG